VTLSVAIVGCGKIADGHLSEISKLPRLAKTVAVCDRELLMAEQAAYRFGIPRFYDNLELLLERHRPDVLHILTPPGSHLELVRLAVRHGCHVFVEKPVAPRASQVREILKEADATQKKLTVGYTYLFDPPAQRLREWVAAGRLGEVVHVESSYGYNLDGPFGCALMASPEHWVHQLPGRLIRNNIDHLLNKVAEFLPDEAPTIQSSANVLRSKRFGDRRDSMQDELRVLLQGSRVTAHCSFSSHARPITHYCRVTGTRCSAVADFVTRTVVLEPESRLPGPFGRLAPAFQKSMQLGSEALSNVWRFARADFHFFAGLAELLTRFYQSILTAGPPPIAYGDIQRVANWIDRVVEAGCLGDHSDPALRHAE
jgi:predicted dehydrogenase